MTQTFQVGDIVFVNPPSQEDILFRSYEGLGGDLDDVVEQYAVITSVESIEETIVRLYPCDADYVFKMEDTVTVFTGYGATTRTTHLTLVRPSTLRTCSTSDGRLSSAGLLTLPVAGSMLNKEFSFLNGKHLDTILDGAVVDEVYLHKDGIGVRCCNLDVDLYDDVNEYVTFIVPTQCIGESQACVSLFTTF